MTIHLIVSLRVSFLLTGPYCSSTGLLVSSEKHTWLIKMKYIVEIVQIIPRDIHIRRGTNRFFQHSFFPIRVDIYNNNDRWYVSISSLLSRVHVVPIVLYIYARSRPLETTVGEKAGETRVEDVILGGWKVRRGGLAKWRMPGRAHLLPASKEIEAIELFFPNGSIVERSWEERGRVEKGRRLSGGDLAFYEGAE